jgi:hypothetical protein
MMKVKVKIFYFDLCFKEVAKIEVPPQESPNEVYKSLKSLGIPAQKIWIENPDTGRGDNFNLETLKSLQSWENLPAIIGAPLF